MNKKLRLAMFGMVAGTTMMAAASANAACSDVTRAQFIAAANTAATETAGYGFGLPMWATMVDTSGRVCQVYSTDGAPNIGATAGNNAWLGSRVISAQKANTANAFSLDGLALSTGAVYVAVQPGGSLYGLQHSNPVNAAAAYSFVDGFGIQRSLADLGTRNDPLSGKRVGGVNVFGGGVALYNGSGVKVGGLGASGDSSCRDHVFAWRMRLALGLDSTPNSDALKFITTGTAPAALFESPVCDVSAGTNTLLQTTNLSFGIQ